MVSNALKLPIGEVNINAKLVKSKIKLILLNLIFRMEGIAEEDQEKIFDKFVQIEEKK
jgi:signal transduction histidine kinase